MIRLAGELGRHTMTPKLKLREHAKKTLLSWILKFFLPGNRRTMLSTHIMEAPRTQAKCCHGLAKNSAEKIKVA
jgi:hypothetical protein